MKEIASGSPLEWVGTCRQVSPSHRRARGRDSCFPGRIPTASAKRGPRAMTSSSEPVKGVGTTLQASPFQCSIRTFAPALPLPDVVGCGCGNSDQPRLDARDARALNDSPSSSVPVFDERTHTMALCEPFTHRPGVGRVDCCYAVEHVGSIIGIRGWGPHATRRYMDQPMPRTTMSPGEASGRTRYQRRQAANNESCSWRPLTLGSHPSPSPSCMKSPDRRTTPSRTPIGSAIHQPPKEEDGRGVDGISWRITTHFRAFRALYVWCTIKACVGSPRRGLRGSTGMRHGARGERCTPTQAIAISRATPIRRHSSSVSSEVRGFDHLRRGCGVQRSRSHRESCRSSMSSR
jgi:hypothetical protein